MQINPFNPICDIYVEEFGGSKKSCIIHRYKLQMKVQVFLKLCGHYFIIPVFTQLITTHVVCFIWLA